jgi:hypothetical protein
MLNEPRHSSAPVTLSATSRSDRQPPPWWAQAVVLVRHIWAQWMLMPLSSALALSRRAGTYEACDFLLVLICLVLSNAPSIRSFYQEVPPIAEVLFALWGRKKMPHRSALSRWLLAIDPSVVEHVRTLFVLPC